MHMRGPNEQSTLYVRLGRTESESESRPWKSHDEAHANTHAGVRVDLGNTVDVRFQGSLQGASLVLARGSTELNRLIIESRLGCIKTPWFGSLLGSVLVLVWVLEFTGNYSVHSYIPTEYIVGN
jgi:hypothetical protein